MPKTKSRDEDGGFGAQGDFPPSGMPPSHSAKQLYSSEMAEGGSPQRSLLRNQTSRLENHHGMSNNLANHFPSAANPDLINHDSRHTNMNNYEPQHTDGVMMDIPLSSPDNMMATDNVMNRSTMSNGSGRGVTMTGTMKRGKKGREVVEVQVELSERELKTLKRTSKIMDQKKDDCLCGPLKGPHILLLSLLFIPFALIATISVVFYVGTMCWYNIYLFLSEEKSIWHKIFLCPLLLLFYPFLIVFSVIGIGVYGAVIQVSWWYYSWYKEIRDFDKGFFGWLCNKLNVPQCAPYEVVIIEDVSPNAMQSGPQDVVTTNV